MGKGKASVALALILLMILSGCADVKTHGEPHEKEKTVSSVEARVEKYLSSDDISIFVENKAAKPDEFIVYSSLPPKGQELERKILALRIVNQVMRDYPKATFISIWDNAEAAGQIAKNGDLDASWDGYLHHVAFAIKNAYGVRVSYALGPDDFDNISFGMSLSR
ncbi:hypothetical protein [Brevibacillus centrosporus]|uniref:hypothetical protein n=1 Tax=Brevibacillus centrosporus TaxID=54910 RepID=UPI000B8062FA|nr:hypothetical protein [Brevibacillus centrosporus]MED4907957.1 hypothetical protein [Brevibacillus centrosporus]